MSLFVLSCKDGWVSIMYDGLDAVGVDQQVNTHRKAHTKRKSYLDMSKEYRANSGSLLYKLRYLIVFLVLFNISLRQHWTCLFQVGREDFSGEKDGVWEKSRQMHRCELTVFLLIQDLHCLVCALSSSSPPSPSFVTPYSSPPPSCFPVAKKKPRPLDAAIFHLLSPHRQLLRAQHVCWRGGGKLSQVSAAAGGGGGTAEGGETTKTLREKEEEWEWGDGVQNIVTYIHEFCNINILKLWGMSFKDNSCTSHTILGGGCRSSLILSGYSGAARNDQLDLWQIVFDNHFTFYFI